jgi:hypothetical protein
VVHGEAGVGKTALLEDAVASAAGMRIARVAGIESEMELAYAALQQLCAQMLDGLDRLPDPQREALGVVFGLRPSQRRQDGAVRPVRLGPGDLAPRHRYLLTEHHDFRVLGGLAAAEQHQPAEDPDHDQVEQSRTHMNRDLAATSPPGQTAGHRTYASFEAVHRRQASHRFTEDDIQALTNSLGNLRDVIRAADPAVKAAIYEQLGLQVTYLPGQDKLRADVTISPEKFLEHIEQYGVMGSVRGGT